MKIFLGIVGGIVLGIVLAWIERFDFNERSAFTLFIVAYILIAGFCGALVGYMFENS